MKQAPRLYFAYGSNLHRAQMKERCPDAKPVRRLSIRGWKLVFRGSADMQPGAKTDVIHGALYQVSKRDEKNLDTFEGVRADGQGLYRKIEFMIPASGERVFCYLMTSGDIYPPSDAYFGIIREGFREWRLPRHYLLTANNDASEAAMAAVAAGKVVRGRGRGSRT